MKLRILLIAVMLMSIILPAFFTAYDVSAETESDFFKSQKERKESDWNKWRERYDKNGMARVTQNAAYSARCGGCHFLYQPWLLPARSWSAIMGSVAKHFGRELTLKDKDAKEILQYLKANSADNIKPRNEWTLKILRSVRRLTPRSIRDIPYIQRRHRRMTPDIIARPAILSLSNCVACHSDASLRGYKKKNLSVPR